MLPVEWQRLDQLERAQLQKVAVRFDANGTPGLLLTLYQQQKIYFGFMGQRCHGGDVSFELEQWQEAQPAKNQQAFRHHLLKAQLVHVKAQQGVVQTTWAHPDGKTRHVFLEPGKGNYCCLLGIDTEAGIRIVAFHGHASDKIARRKTGQLFQWPAQALRPLNGLAASPAPAPVRDPRLALIKRELKRLKTLQKNLESDRQRLGDPEVRYRQGELLAMHLHEIKKGQKSWSVLGEHDQAEEIPLDPRLTPSQNLEQVYRLAKKSKRGQAQLLPRLKQVAARLALLEAARDNLDELSEEALRDLLRAKALAPSARRRAALAGSGKPWRCFAVSEDAFVLVGKHAKGNDALTFHHAKGLDGWFHVRDAAGAHVIVPQRFAKQPAVQEAAAQLAVHFSPLRRDTRVEVRYTQRKNLRKPGKGAPAGKVLVSAEENRTVRPDPEAIAKLLAAEKPV